MPERRFELGPLAGYEAFVSEIGSRMPIRCRPCPRVVEAILKLAEPVGMTRNLLARSPNLTYRQTD